MHDSQNRQTQCGIQIQRLSEFSRLPGKCLGPYEELLHRQQKILLPPPQDSLEAFEWVKLHDIL